MLKLADNFLVKLWIFLCCGGFGAHLTASSVTLPTLHDLKLKVNQLQTTIELTRSALHLHKSQGEGARQASVRLQQQLSALKHQDLLLQLQLKNANELQQSLIGELRAVEQQLRLKARFLGKFYANKIIEQTGRRGSVQPRVVEYLNYLSCHRIYC